MNLPPKKVIKRPIEAKNPAASAPATHTDQKVGAAQVFGRQALPARPLAPESMGPDKDAVLKQRKMGAADIFGRRR